MNREMVPCFIALLSADPDGATQPGASSHSPYRRICRIRLTAHRVLQFANPATNYLSPHCICSSLPIGGEKKWRIYKQQLASFYYLFISSCHDYSECSCHPRIGASAVSIVLVLSWKKKVQKEPDAEASSTIHVSTGCSCAVRRRPSPRAAAPPCRFLTCAFASLPVSLSIHHRPVVVAFANSVEHAHTAAKGIAGGRFVVEGQDLRVPLSRRGNMQALRGDTVSLVVGSDKEIYIKETLMM